MTTMSATKLGFGNLSLLNNGNGNGNGSSEYDTPAISANANEVASGFRQLLEDWTTATASSAESGTAATSLGVRRAACCMALMETVKEGREGVAALTPNEMFVVCIAALTSLQEKFEAKQQQQQQQQSSGSISSIQHDLENTALPVLELLRRTLPYVAHWTNNSGALLLHQFTTVSRMLRMFVAWGYALPSAVGSGGDGGGDGSQPRRENTKGGSMAETSTTSGPNALLRQVLKFSTTLLLVTPPIDVPATSVGSGRLVSEKDLAKLLHATIVPMFHDLRPKVRKAAWGCGMELVVLASSSSSFSCLGGEDATAMPDNLATRIQHQRKIVADFVWEYCHAVMNNYTSSSSSKKKSKINKERSSKVIHVLRFLATALPYADDTRIRIRFGECCLTMLLAGGSGNIGGGDGSIVVSVEVVMETLVVLSSCLEMTQLEQELLDPNDASTTMGGGGGGKYDEAMSKFASQCLASLLQHRPSGGRIHTNSHVGDDNVNTVYGRCLMACMVRMLGTTKEPGDDIKGCNEEVSTSKLLAIKLTPNVLTSMLHICEASSGSEGREGEGGGGQHDCCGAAFNQFVTHIFPVIVSNLDEQQTTTNVKLRRVSLETLPLCIPIVQRALQIQYRSAWGSILSGGYATFTLTLARHLLERRMISSVSVNNDDEDGVEFHDQLSLWVRTLVLSLLRLHDDVARGGGAARTAVEYATSTIIRGMGIELFLSVVDFVNEDGDGGGATKNKSLSSSSTTGGGIRDDRAWLLPLMKQSVASTLTVDDDGITSRTHLSFFQGNVLNLARKCDAASADDHRTAAEASIQKARVVELWSLFPSFCVCPLDMKENFGSVAKTVVKALGDHGRYPKLIPIICGGLKTVAIGIMERAKASPEASEDYTVLSNVSTKILPSLFKLVETLNESSTKESCDAMEIDALSSSKESQSQSQQNMQLVEAVTDAIGQLAQVCPPEFLQTLFKKVIQRLLLATTEIAESSGDTDAKLATAMKMSSMLGLGQALVASGSLDDTSLALLFRAVRPLVRTDEHDPRVQKRAYKVLAEICERHKEFVTSDERLGEMMDLVVDSIVTCQVSARNMRLKCMTHIVQGFNSKNISHMEVIPKVMGEVLLCLKDSNTKTREAAYQLLLAMAVARDDMADYFRIILAALGAQTTHMRSASVMALSRLAFEYARVDHTVQELLPSLMQTVSVLFDDSSREVTKSVIGFVRVCVAAMTRDQLEPLLPDIVGGIMKYNKGKDRHRAKIKIILKKLVRVYGYNAIANLVPDEHARLITHMRKLSERAARRKACGVQDGRSDTNNGFENMMNSDEDDSDDGRTFMTGVTGFTKMTATSGKTTKVSKMDRSVKSKGALSGARSTMSSKSAKGKEGPRLKAELNGEILDMLDASKMARSVHFADADMQDRDFSDDDDGGGADDFLFDAQGRIVISDGMPMSGERKKDADDSNSEEEDESSGKRRRVSKFESVKLAKAEKDKEKGMMQKARKEGTASLGGAYKSKKAGGDVRKKGQKYEPYAYVPLDARDFTKKNRGRAVSKMSSVVRSSTTKRKR